MLDVGQPSRCSLTHIRYFITVTFVASQADLGDRYVIQMSRKLKILLNISDLIINGLVRADSLLPTPSS